MGSVGSPVMRGRWFRSVEASRPASESLTVSSRRVLVVLKSDGVGGVERQVDFLVEGLTRHGIDCDITALGAARSGGLLGVDRVRVLEPSIGRGWRRRVMQALMVKRLVRTGGHAAVVSFGPNANAVVALARGRNGPRTVIAEVGDPFIERRRRWNRWFMWTYRRADVLVVLTEQLAAELRPSRRRPREVVVIPNGLAPDVPLVDPASARDHRIIGVGRLVPDKGYGDLIEAFASVGGAADGWSLVIVGDGVERESLERAAAALGIADRVTFTGMLEAPWEMMATAEIFVLCSRNEGFATVLLEAMASGCAVIASDCRFGPAEVLADGSGVLYPVGDVEALAQHLGCLIADQAQRSTLAEAGRRRIEHFAADRVWDLWMAVIDRDRQPAVEAPPNQ